jgi:hypothetical protein
LLGVGRGVDNPTSIKKNIVTKSEEVKTVYDEKPFLNICGDM